MVSTRRQQRRQEIQHSSSHSWLALHSQYTGHSCCLECTADNRVRRLQKASQRQHPCYDAKDKRTNTHICGQTSLQKLPLHRPSPNLPNQAMLVRVSHTKFSVNGCILAQSSPLITSHEETATQEKLQSTEQVCAAFKKKLKETSTVSLNKCCNWLHIPSSSQRRADAACAALGLSDTEWDRQARARCAITCAARRD